MNLFDNIRVQDIGVHLSNDTCCFFWEKFLQTIETDSMTFTFSTVNPPYSGPTPTADDDHSASQLWLAKRRTSSLPATP